MIRRFVLCLAAIAAALLIAAPPSSAEVQTSKCWTLHGFDTDSHICLWVNYQPSSHTITLVRDGATGDLGNFESKIEDCDNLRLWNDNQTVIWRKDDAQCDLTQADPSDTWFPGNTLPQSDHANFGWTFYPKVDGGADPGYTHISLVVTF